MRVQDAGLQEAADPDILAWAGREGRVLLTHDVATMTAYAYAFVREGRPMVGVIEVPTSLAVGRAVEDLVLIAECGDAEDFRDQVRYLPL